MNCDKAINTAFLREYDPPSVFYVPCMVYGGVSGSFVGLTWTLSLM